MRVVKLNFEKLGKNKNFLKLTAEVVEKPFTWVIKNKVMPCCQEIDPGPIDPDQIPIPLFENWREFGVSQDQRSVIIPDMIDLNAHEDANTEIRLFGTINLVELIERNEFEPEDTGLKAYLQFLLKTLYVRKSAKFEEDMMPAAMQALQVWDKDSIFAFVAQCLGKRVFNISVADVAHVVHVITGNTVDIKEENFNLMKVAQQLPTAAAAAARPDEFFCAAFNSEVMEYDIVKDLIVDVDDGFYFGKDAEHPKFWAVTGPGAVTWRAEIQRHDKSNDVTVEWGPMAGTLYDRAVDSMRALFGQHLGTDIPFTLPIEKCAVLDQGLYPVRPKNFNTGLRYMTVNQTLPIYKVVLAVSDVSTIEKEINRYPIARLPQNPSGDEIINELVSIYNNELNGMDTKLVDRHFLVYDRLTKLAEDEEQLDYCESEEANAERLDTYVLPGQPQIIRSILMYVWVLKHQMTDTLCYQQADNDDFSVESAIEYCMDFVLGNNKKKSKSTYLVNCAYSTPFGNVKRGMREVVNLDRGLNFDSF